MTCKSVLAADTIDVLDAHELDLASIVWTVANYVVADLKDLLPRTGEYKVKPVIVETVKTVNAKVLSSTPPPSSSGLSTFFAVSVGVIALALVVFALVKTFKKKQGQYSNI